MSIDRGSNPSSSTRSSHSHQLETLSSARTWRIQTQILNFSSFLKLEDSNFLDRRDSNLSYFSHRNCDKAKTEGIQLEFALLLYNLAAGNTNFYLLKCNICFAWDGVRNFVEDATTLSNPPLRFAQRSRLFSVSSHPQFWKDEISLRQRQHLWGYLTINGEDLLVAVETNCFVFLIIQFVSYFEVEILLLVISNGSLTRCVILKKRVFSFFFCEIIRGRW